VLIDNSTEASIGAAWSGGIEVTFNEEESGLRTGAGAKHMAVVRHLAIDSAHAADDVEAQSIGWPCVGEHRAVMALIVARGMAAGYRFRIVPRGSTPAAADAHDRALGGGDDRGLENAR